MMSERERALEASMLVQTIHERDSAKGRLAAADRECDNLRAEVAEATEQRDSFEGRYLCRLKERDALAAEKEQLHATADSLLATNATAIEELEKQRGQLAEVTRERDEKQALLIVRENALRSVCRLLSDDDNWAQHPADTVDLSRDVAKQRAKLTADLRDSRNDAEQHRLAAEAGEVLRLEEVEEVERLRGMVRTMGDTAEDVVARFRNLAKERDAADPGLLHMVNEEQQRVDDAREALEESEPARYCRDEGWPG